VTTDVQARNREAIFSKLDSNNDGAIDENDVRGHIGNFLGKYGVPADSAQGRQAFQAGDQLWQELSQADTDGDRVITKAEFVQSMNENLVERTYISMNTIFFTIVDADGDGQITEQELANALTRNGLSPDNVHDAFQKLDLDHNGQITKDEWDQATREMLLGSDPNSAGSVLLAV
jgi:Ca2+-binding EF-hand superfamily protein